MQLAEFESRYFLTWGRIQDPVDPQPVCDLVLDAARHVDLGGTPVSARLCETLREAADSPCALYFFECCLVFARETVPVGESHEAWRERKASAMAVRHEIAYCGRPRA